MESRELSGGRPLTDDHAEINPATGQQKGYVVLSPEERAKGFVQPVRMRYLHRKCGTVTTMARDIAETYARDPAFYDGTFCVKCRTHLPLAEFVWDGTDQVLGTVREVEPPKPTLAPHQQRVVDEKAELDVKREKLASFMLSTTFVGLDRAEQTRLAAQANVMYDYSGLLGERIAAFGNG